MPEQPNDSSDFQHARDHLANERTFLAWIRTSLAIIGLGFVVVKFSLFVREMEIVVSSKHEIRHAPSYSLPLGLTLIALGAIITIASYFRYRRIQREITMEKFTQSSTLIRVTAIMLVVACGLLIVYLLRTT